MPNIAIVTDSNSGISQAQATELGIYVLPMPFFINEEQFFEDITLSVDDFYGKMAEDAGISTSQPSPDSVMSLWAEALRDHDEVVHIPMSSGLSGSCESAMMLAGEFDGKVHVVNNQRISVTQKRSVLDAIELAAAGFSGEEIKNKLEEDKKNSSIYIMLNTLYYLKKGGRITPAAAALGTLLKIKPVLQIQGEKLDAFAKARTVNQGKTIMLNAIKSDIENRFGGQEKSHVWLYVVHSQNLEAALALKAELEQEYPGVRVDIDQLSLSVACHIGPGCLAIACCRKMNTNGEG